MTTFRLDDTDDLVKLLLVVGQIGRDNIQSLDFAWESNMDIEHGWGEAGADDPSLTLPSLHIPRCVKLLKQCKRLRFLRIRFDEDLVKTIHPETFKADPGIQALCSLQGIREAEV